MTHPEIGPPRDNLAPGLHAHFYTDYVIYYVASDKEIIIVRVLHRSRDARAVFNEEDANEKEVQHD